MSQSPELLLIVGSCNLGKADGLLLYRFDTRTGALKPVASFREGVRSPLYVATDPQKKFLFVADYVEECNGKKGGAILSYALDSTKGTLRFINQQHSEGTIPCYVSVSRNGKFLLTANYGDGKVSVLPIRDNGELAPAIQVAPHVDGGKQAHAHSIVFDAAQRFAFAGELGLDQVVRYSFDPATGKLARLGEWRAQPGSGPRHFVFHPNGRFAYVINEYGNTMVAFAYDAATGALTELQTLPTLPPGFTETSYCADVQVHPSGKFLYGSNRGHDSIVIYAIDPGTGRMTLVGHEPTQGSYPRSFEIEPSGTFLVVGNEKGNNLLTFRIDAATGKLTPTGQKLEAVAPACMWLVR